MKEFDLKAALNGEPVMLRNGEKAYLVGRTPAAIKMINMEYVQYPLVGYSVDANELVAIYFLNWTENGKLNILFEENNRDIIGMWEEPKISIEDLPKPFKPKDGEPFYYINGGCIEYKREYRYSNLFDRYAAENGNCFRTREDAEMWLKLMKGMLE